MLLPQPMPLPEVPELDCAFLPFLFAWSGRACEDCGPLISKVCAQPGLTRNREKKRAKLTRLFFTRTTVVGSFPAATRRPPAVGSTTQQRPRSKSRHPCAPLKRQAVS